MNEVHRPDQASDSALAAAILHTGPIWWALSSLIQAGLFFSAMTDLSFRHSAPALAVMGLCLWLVGTWCATRVQIDAHLFEWMTHTADIATALTQLDDSLHRVLKRQHPRHGRPLDERINGALRWYRLLVITTLAHLGLLALQSVLRFS